MGTLLLVLLIVFGLFVSEVSKQNILGFILAYTLVFILTGFVTYTPDWKGYENWISTGVGRDIFFNFLIQRIGSSGYRIIHLIFTSTYSFLLVFIISRFSKKTYLIVLLYLPIVYLHYTTQIRFFMGYFSMCLAFYYWFAVNKRKFAVALAVFAIANHLSLLIFIPLVYFFKIKINSLMARVIYGMFIVVLIYIAVFSVLLKLPQGMLLIGYLTSANQDSSLLGGLFTFLPALILFFVINNYSKRKIKKYPSIVDDKKFQFLYRFSIIPLVFMGIALNRQIIGQRFIIPAVLFQIILMFYLSKFNPKNQNSTLIAFTALFLPLYYIYIYILPPIIGVNEIAEKVGSMLNSNSILNYFF